MAMASFNLSSLGASLRVNTGRRSCFRGNGSVKLISRQPKICMMAKRENELIDIRSMSTEDINESVVDLKGELFLMRCKKATRQGFVVSDYTHMKKKIARMLTVKRERELELGIKPRESRKLKREWARSVVPRPPPSLRPILAKRDQEAAAKKKEAADKKDSSTSSS